MNGLDLMTRAATRMQLAKRCGFEQTLID